LENKFIEAAQDGDADKAATQMAQDEKLQTIVQTVVAERQAEQPPEVTTEKLGQNDETAASAESEKTPGATENKPGQQPQATLTQPDPSVSPTLTWSQPPSPTWIPVRPSETLAVVLNPYLPQVPASAGGEWQFRRGNTSIAGKEQIKDWEPYHIRAR